MRPLGGLVSVISKARGVLTAFHQSVDLLIHVERIISVLRGKAVSLKTGAAYEGPAEQVAYLIFVILERNAELYLCANHLFLAFVSLSRHLCLQDWSGSVCFLWAELTTR